MLSTPPSSPFPDDQQRRPPGRLIAVAIVGVILFSLLYLENPSRFAPTPTPMATPIPFTPDPPGIAPTPASLSALATSRAEAMHSSGPEVSLPTHLTEDSAHFTALTPTPDCARLTETVDRQSGPDTAHGIRPVVYGERAIEYGAEITDQLDACGQAWFTFTGAPGDRLAITLVIPNGQTSLAVYDAAMQRLIAVLVDPQPEIAEIRDYLLPADGRYYILASDALGRPLFYHLSLQRLP